MSENNNPAEYENLPRVTNIIKEIYGEPDPGWLVLCGECNNKNIPTENEILEWSSEFGTKVHDKCLEQIDTLFEKAKNKEIELYNDCINQFHSFGEKFAPKTIWTEKIIVVEDEFKNKIYAGTADWLCYIKGEKWLIDLKTWGCWRWRFGYKLPNKAIDSAKAAKTNLQTELYANGLDEKVKRGVLWVTPTFFIFKEFKKPSNRFDEAIQIAKKLSNSDNLQW